MALQTTVASEGLRQISHNLTTQASWNMTGSKIQHWKQASQVDITGQEENRLWGIILVTNLQK